jgi:hypothetical protein
VGTDPEHLSRQWQNHAGPSHVFLPSLDLAATILPFALKRSPGLLLKASKGPVLQTAVNLLSPSKHLHRISVLQFS